ncbi:hypothetical protein DDK22_11605 [Cupriavidus necator]|uniref:Uncharacterized protein n=1 Tax=Cupriavidus necator TaxID=106590 RepID=A0A367PK49_CUPNE|nr:hypothetical protein DDK22_11605 [Cupriavidus necator]
MAWGAGLHGPEIRQFLGGSAVYLFRLRRIPAMARRCFVKPAMASGFGGAWTGRAPNQRLSAVL